MAVSIASLTQGPGILYRGAWGAAEPADSEVNNTPAASAWTDVGGTSDGVNLTINHTYKELEVDQIVEIPGRRLVKREATLETNLAEPTLANLALVMNASAPATGAGFAYYDPVNDSSAVQPVYSALIFDGLIGGYKRRVFLRRTLQVESVKTAYKKDGQTLLTASFAAHYVSSSIRPFRVVDATA